MRRISQFGSVLEAAEHLTLEEKETLLEVLRKRTIEKRRAQLKRDIAEARREFVAGKCRPASPRQIMRDIHAGSK